MLRQLIHELLSILSRDFRLDVEFLTDDFGCDFRKRSGTVRRLPNRGGHFVQSEKRGIHCGHYHHLATQHAGCDCGAARDVFFSHSLSLSNQIPNPRIRGECKPLYRYAIDKFTCRAKNQRYQLGVLGKKEDVPQQAAGRFGRVH